MLARQYDDSHWEHNWHAYPVEHGQEYDVPVGRVKQAKIVEKGRPRVLIKELVNIQRPGLPFVAGEPSIDAQFQFGRRVFHSECNER